MALDQFLTALGSMLDEARACLATVDNAESLEQLRVKYTGAKSGALKTVQKMLGSIDVKDKPAAGMRFNEVRDGIEEALGQAALRLGQAAHRLWAAIGRARFRPDFAWTQAPYRDDPSDHPNA